MYRLVIILAALFIASGGLYVFDPGPPPLNVELTAVEPQDDPALSAPRDPEVTQEDILVSRTALPEGLPTRAPAVVLAPVPVPEPPVQTSMAAPAMEALPALPTAPTTEAPVVEMTPELDTLPAPAPALVEPDTTEPEPTEVAVDTAEDEVLGEEIIVNLTDRVATVPLLTEHVVQRGESLSRIANKYYGATSGFVYVFEANRDKLNSPEALEIGMKLRIPDISQF